MEADELETSGVDAGGVSARDFEFEKSALDRMEGVEFCGCVHATMEPAFAFFGRIDDESVGGVSDEGVSITFECAGERDVHPKLLPVGGAFADAVVLWDSGADEKEAAFGALSLVEPAGTIHGVEDEPVGGALVSADSVPEAFASIARDHDCLAPECGIGMSHTVEYYMP